MPAEGDIRRFRALAVYAPRPPYPYEARARREQGSGLAVLTVDPATGNVTNVVMRASTGVGIVDEVTVSTFSQWIQTRHGEQGKSSNQLLSVGAWRPWSLVRC